MIVTTYTCDKCGAEQDNKIQMWDIGILVRSHGTGQIYENPQSDAKELWCRKCVEGLGLLPAPKVKTPAKPPPATLEDKIRVIIHQEIEKLPRG